MRRVLGITTLLSVFAAAGPARAGVYNLAQKRAFAGRGSLDQDVRKQLEEMSPQTVLGDVGALRSINDGAPSAQEEGKATLDRRQTVKRTEEREAQQKQAPLGTADALSLSADYIRLGRAEKARALLEAINAKLPEDDPYRFLVLLNLAAAYEITPEFLDRAVLTQKQALAAWPKEWQGWSADDLAWYRLAEKYYLTYLEARYVEAQRNGGTSPPLQSVAPLFPKARFDEPGRDYQAGSLPPDTGDALPLDALQVVAQLLLWLPNDSRLYWLYAELLNGRGYLPEAKLILDDLYENRFVRAAKAHREAVDQAVAALPQKTNADPVSSPSPPAKGSDLWVPDWRQLSGGFVAGVVITALVMMQLREWARRRAERGAS